MNWGVGIRTAISFIILILLHYSLRPFLGWRAPVDFMLLALLLLAVRLRPGIAAIVGFLLGMISDSINPGSFGAAALGMTIVGYSASWLKAVFFADNVSLNAFFFFVGKWLFDLIFVLAEHKLSGVAVFQQALLWSPLSAALTAVAGVLILILFKPLLETASS
jgi:rod shape-determining protein MreD